MYHYKNILVVSDNQFLVEAFHKITTTLTGITVTYTCSPQNTALLNNTSLPVTITPLSVKTDWKQLNYDLIFSLHCKQLFPEELVKKTKCINVHPGLNPYNRGWFPQVFSILNGKKSGATIHEIDEQLDHGRIIAQCEVPIARHDTSLTAYLKIQDAEVELLKENIGAILNNTYTAWQPDEEGNINLKKDFNALCKIDLNKQVTMAEAIDYLRAMTHGQYQNAYYIDPVTGDKVFVSVQFKVEKSK
ncbi:MAG TPA: dTDP-4-amino-4,6-dideoxyglucose formyltransferase [Chitinophagales bacterium]|nr:dTDP-4-amino-4,6-dideoxyglucose formyltransferase [Chitinophagales bacterium]